MSNLFCSQNVSMIWIVVVIFIMFWGCFIFNWGYQKWRWEMQGYYFEKGRENYHKKKCKKERGGDKK